MRRSRRTAHQSVLGISSVFQLFGRPLFQVLILVVTSLSFCLIFITSVLGLLLKTKLLPTPASKPKQPSRPKVPLQLPRPQVTLPHLRIPQRQQWFVTLPVALAIFTLTGFSIYHFIQKLPSPYDLIIRNQKLTTQILDRNGRLLFKIYRDENRTPVKLDTLPDHVKHAFLAAEDNNFYQHQGFSFTGIFRALTKNLTSDHLEGGSTITQQLVKNALLSPERTWQRKVKELILSIETEVIYDKDTIFEMYLNEVGFGGPAYGIQEAAQQYFGINAKNLDLAQSAFLAGLPKAPSKFSPFINPDLAHERQKMVLDLMLKDKYISKEAHDLATQEKLAFIPPKIEINAPHFVMYIRDLLVDRFGEELVSHGGLKVTTTLDLDLQNQTENYLNTELSHLGNYNVSNGAVLITRPQTGEILAMVGSRNYFDIGAEGQVNLTTSLRQPGSSIKPVNYALAFENGFTPNTVIQDVPITFNIPGTQPWSPKNYDGRFHGSVTLRQALANSYNIPAVVLLARNGVKNMIDLGRKMGITSWDDESRFGLSLTLGSGEVRMTDMAVAYGTIANLGKSIPLQPIIKIEDLNGRPLSSTFCPQRSDNDCSPRQAIKPSTAFLLTDILSDNNARSAAFGINSALNIPNHTTAVKTGTSNDLRDNWTIGFTPDYLVATWVGNNDNSPMSRIASGVTGASPVWNKVMTSLLERNPHNSPFIQPDDLVKVSVCNLTGSLTCAGCPSHLEYFIKGSEPKYSCNPDNIQKLLEDQAKKQADAAKILDGAQSN